MAAGMLLAPRAQGSKRKRFGAKPRLHDTWLASGGVIWSQLMPLSAQPVFVKRKYKSILPLGVASTNNDLSRTDNGELDEVVDLGDTSHATESVPGSSSLLSPPFRTRILRWLPNSHNQASDASRRRAEQDNTDDNLFTETVLADTHLASPSDNTRPPTSSSIIPPASPSDAKPSATNTGYKVRVEMLQVSVLIAMPSPSRSARKNAMLDRVGKGDLMSDEDDEDDDEEEALPELVFGVTRVHYRQSRAGKIVPTSIPDTRQELQLPDQQQQLSNNTNPTISMVPEEVL